MDLASLSYQANLGHGHPAMVAAIKEQAEKFCLALPNHTFEAKERLAMRLLELAPPGFSKVFFTLGGSEAVENAIKIAKLVTGRYKTVSRYRSYHGASAGALSLSGDYRRPPLEPLMTGALHALDCYCYRCPFGHQPESCHIECASQFEHILGLEGQESVAAVFCEPFRQWVIEDSFVGGARPDWDKVGAQMECKEGGGKTAVARCCATAAAAAGGVLRALRFLDHGPPLSSLAFLWSDQVPSSMHFEAGPSQT